ncbi:hypothetical protein [Candidatus Competibacter phosphatis]|nr:hypothetical protein [Candidatus Competibacter phosphatis]
MTKPQIGPVGWARSTSTGQAAISSRLGWACRAIPSSLSALSAPTA